MGSVASHLVSDGGRDNPNLIITATLILVVGSLPLVHSPTRRMFETWKARIVGYWKATKRLQQAKDRPINGAQSGNETTPSPTLTGLFIHPVKSSRPVSIPEAKLDANGLVGDRRFMLVADAIPPPHGFLKTDPKHRFISQRQCPQLATVTAQVVNHKLRLSSRGAGSLEIDLSKRTRTSSLRARLWTDVVDVQDVGDEAAAYFEKVVAPDATPEVEGIRLVRLAGTRYSSDEFVPPHARTWTGSTPLAGLTDGFPLLIACQKSLDEVNRRLKAKGKKPIPMSRFRPNLVISNTTKPFEEDSWKRLQIGHVELHIVKACPRCRQSCTDQLTGKVSDEPLEVLKEFRALGSHADEVFFAQNAIAFGSKLRVGDQVLVLERGEPVWDNGEKTPPE